MELVQINGRQGPPHNNNDNNKAQRGNKNV